MQMYVHKRHILIESAPSELRQILGSKKAHAIHPKMRACFPFYVSHRTNNQTENISFSQ